MYVQLNKYRGTGNMEETYVYVVYRQSDVCPCSHIRVPPISRHHYSFAVNNKTIAFYFKSISEKDSTFRFFPTMVAERG